MFAETRRLTHKAVISGTSDATAEATKKRKGDTDDAQDGKSKKAK